MLLDIALVLIVLVAFFLGYRKGIIFMIFFLLGITLGLFASLELSYITTQYLESYLSLSDEWMPILSFVCSFLIVFLLAIFLARLLENLMKIVFLGFFNRLAGGLVAGLIAFGTVSILYWYLQNLELLQATTTAESKFFDTSIAFAPFFIQSVSAILPFATDLMDQMQELFEKFAVDRLQMEQ